MCKVLHFHDNLLVAYAFPPLPLGSPCIGMIDSVLPGYCCICHVLATYSTAMTACVFPDTIFLHTLDITLV